MTRLITVADDLTGANANASLLAARGFSAATCCRHDQWDPELFREFDVVSINAGSRLLPEAEARAIVAQTVRAALAVEPLVMAKRIDSTLRGNLGGEIEAALEAMPEGTLAVICPAFPASQRIAAGGHLIVEGMPLEQSSVARDPANPIHTSDIARLVTAQTRLPLEYIRLETVLAGVDALEAALRHAYGRQCRMVAVDAVTDRDIAALAQAAARLPWPVLAVDPGPFTAALALERLGKAPRPRENRALLVVGSVMDVVQRQLELLSVKRHCELVLADCRKLAVPGEAPAEIARIVAEVGAAPEDAHIVGVCTARCPEDIIPLDTLAQEEGVEMHVIAQRINQGLAAVATQLLAQPELRLGGLFTSGGEVTLAVTQTLGALGFSVRDEVLPRAMYGRLIGGQCPGLPMVTKGGFVGDDAAILHCMDYLFTKISTRVVAR